MVGIPFCGYRPQRRDPAQLITTHRMSLSGGMSEKPLTISDSVSAPISIATGWISRPVSESTFLPLATGSHSPLP